MNFSFFKMLRPSKIHLSVRCSRCLGESLENSTYSVAIIKQSAFKVASLKESLKWTFLSFLNSSFAFFFAIGSNAKIFETFGESFFTIFIPTESLMSSVFGLKDRPRKAIFLFFKLPA